MSEKVISCRKEQFHVRLCQNTKPDMKTLYGDMKLQNPDMKMTRILITFHVAKVQISCRREGRLSGCVTNRRKSNNGLWKKKIVLYLYSIGRENPRRCTRVRVRAARVRGRVGAWV